MQRLKEAAEKAKIELSSAEQTEVNLPYITADENGPKHFVQKITRAKLESLVGDLVTKSLEPVKTALKDAGLSASEVDEIIRTPLGGFINHSEESNCELVGIGKSKYFLYS